MSSYGDLYEELNKMLVSPERRAVLVAFERAGLDIDNRRVELRASLAEVLDAVEELDPRIPKKLRREFSRARRLLGRSNT